MNTPASHAVLLMVAPNGAHLDKARVPGLPITPEELAGEAAACLREGAAAMHLHVRDAHGRHSLDPAHYEAALKSIRARVGERMLLQITTEAGGAYDWRAQMAVARALKPRGVSVALREFLPEGANEEREREVAAFFRWLARERLAPQLILHAPAEVARLAELRARGIVPWRNPLLLFVVGRRVGAEATETMLEEYLLAAREVPDAVWMACAFGAAQLEVLTVAATRGGHVRVGFENGDLLPGGARASSNAEMVAELRRMLARRGVRLMDAAAARILLRDIALISS